MRVQGTGSLRIISNRIDDVFVSQLLPEDANRKNYHFVPRDMRLDDVIALFAARELLEAVLITANGKASETLLGIATRTDISQLG